MLHHYRDDRKGQEDSERQLDDAFRCRRLFVVVAPCSAVVVAHSLATATVDDDRIDMSSLCRHAAELQVCASWDNHHVNSNINNKRRGGDALLPSRALLAIRARD